MKIFLLVTFCLLPLAERQDGSGSIHKNGMEVSWQIEGSKVWIEVHAPTTGWLGISFNQSEEIVGSYLLMGRIQDGKAEVVEHYTLARGDYRPISMLGGGEAVQDVSGGERDGSSWIRFSIPIDGDGPYRRTLGLGSEHVMQMAYSQDDDFQHHSRMRTSVKVRL
ncbi:MAG: DOMON domain-containing protein [Bacteroidota bacterium]